MGSIWAGHAAGQHLFTSGHAVPDLEMEAGPLGEIQWRPSSHSRWGSVTYIEVGLGLVPGSLGVSLAQSDELFRDPLSLLRLGPCCRNGLVIDQGSHQVPQQGLAMRRRPTELSELADGGWHGDRKDKGELPAMRYQTTQWRWQDGAGAVVRRVRWAKLRLQAALVVPDAKKVRGCWAAQDGS